jgi:hypothetical protein
MLVVRQEIGFDVVEFKIHLVEFVVAVVAKPEQTIGVAFPCTFAFNDESYRVF